MKSVGVFHDHANNTHTAGRGKAADAGCYMASEALGRQCACGHRHSLLCGYVSISTEKYQKGIYFLFSRQTLTRRFAMKLKILLLALCLSLPGLSFAIDYGKLTESVDKEKAADSVDTEKLKDSVDGTDVDYKKAYDSVDGQKAADSVDVDKAKEALAE